MVGINDFLFQIFQPYFFYSVVFLSVTFIIIKIFLKFNPHLPRHSQSLLWLLPLIIPVIVMLLFPPQIMASISPFVSAISAPAGMSIANSSVDLLSFTGLLCIGGAVAALVYLGVMVCFGKKIALKRFHVVMMAKNEYIALQEKIRETAYKLGISEPKIGLIDDLMPNAFTIGYGQKSVIVFSLGLLKMLNLDELTAVASHELAHVKAKDYLFKSVSCALNIFSYFNPLSYLTAVQSQKERELLADERGAALLDKPNLMAEVLTKVSAAVEELPKPSFLDRLSASLFLISPLAHKSSILASHPRIAQRLQNIQGVFSAPSRKRRYMFTSVLLLGILVCAALVVGYSTVSAHEAFSQKTSAALVAGDKFYIFNQSYSFDSALPTGVFFANESSLQLFLSSLQTDSSSSYVDSNGVTHNVTTLPNGLVSVDGRNIVINGQNPFVGNITYPFDPSHPTGIYLVNQSDVNQPEAIGYLAKNGVTYTFQRPILGVYFNTTGACVPIYWPDPAPSWCNYTDISLNPPNG